MDTKKMDVLLKSLTRKNAEYSKLCMVVAEKERMVSELYAKTIIKLQKSCVHITLLKDLARGSVPVLDAKHELSVASTKLRECRDDIKTIQIKMDMNND